jgi:hypothetical protein
VDRALGNAVPMVGRALGTDDLMTLLFGPSATGSRMSAQVQREIARALKAAIIRFLAGR